MTRSSSSSSIGGFFVGECYHGPCAAATTQALLHMASRWRISRQASFRESNASLSDDEGCCALTPLT